VAATCARICKTILQRGERAYSIFAAARAIIAFFVHREWNAAAHFGGRIFRMRCWFALWRRVCRRWHSGDAVFEAMRCACRLRNASFDLVTTAFVFAPLANYEAGLRRYLRVLRPGGTVAILEFRNRRLGFLGRFVSLDFRNLLRGLDAFFVVGDRQLYKLLASWVALFPACLSWRS